MQGAINYLAVAIGAILYFVNSCLWFSKVYERTLFKDLMLPQEEMRKKERHFTLTLLFHFICGYGVCILLSLLLYWSGTRTFFGGVKMGLLLWVGFSVVADVGNYLNENCRQFKDLLIHSGFHLVNAVVLGGILAVWR